MAVARDPMEVKPEAYTPAELKTARSAALADTAFSGFSLYDAALEAHREGETFSVPDSNPDYDDPMWWKNYGSCVGVDPGLFFPERGADTDTPKDICRGCDMASLCLAYALTNNEKFGVWGGTTERERRRWRKQLVLLRAQTGETGPVTPLEIETLRPMVPASGRRGRPKKIA